MLHMQVKPLLPTQHVKKFKAPLPTKPQNVILKCKWTSTSARDNFVADDAVNTRITFFPTDLRHFATSNRIFMNGSFYSKTNQILQVYSTHQQPHMYTFKNLSKNYKSKEMNENEEKSIITSHGLLRLCVPITMG